MHDEEAAGTRCPAMEIEPEKFWPEYKVHKIFKVGRVPGNNNFLGIRCHIMRSYIQGGPKNCAKFFLQ